MDAKLLLGCCFSLGLFSRNLGAGLLKSSHLFDCQGLKARLEVWTECCQQFGVRASQFLQLIQACLRRQLGKLETDAVLMPHARAKPAWLRLVLRSMAICRRWASDDIRQS